MFGISYDYTKVHYEAMPASIRHVCPTFERGTYWTFAHTQRESGDYFVVMGVTPGQDGDSLGVAVVVQGSKCYEEDSTRMFSGFPPTGGYGQVSVLGKLPGLDYPEVCDSGPLGACHYVLRSPEEESLLRELVRDAFARAARAWGDGDRFRNEVCKPSLLEANASTPVVQQELTRFCAKR
jgi:hypothetical protein